MVQIVKRLAKGSALTYEEMDGNFDRIVSELNARPTVVDSSVSIINAILNIKNNVPLDGDTLFKLYNLILALDTNKINKTSIVNNLTTNDSNSVLSAMQGKYLRDALTIESTNRINSVFSETLRATNIENILRADLVKEIANRGIEDNILNTKINNLLANIDTTALNSLSELVAAFQAADNNLINALNTLSINASLEITNETNRALLAEGILQTAIANEIQTRLAQMEEAEQIRSFESDLKVNITDIVDSLNNDKANLPLSANQGRILNNNINSLINNISSGVISDVTLLSQTVAQEITDRATADILEVVNRDSAISSAISTEVQNRNSAIALESSITNNRINNLISNTDEVALNSLSEIVQAFQSTDGELLTSLNTLSVNSNLALNAEIDRATSAETNLDSLIQAEKTLRIEQDLLKVNITDINDSLTSDSNLIPLSANQGKVLKGIIDNEVSLLTLNILQKEVNTQNLIDSEVINRNASIQNAIDAEIINRDLVILNETNSRVAADNLLNTRIDNLLTNTDEVALNSLAEIVTAFQSNDNDILNSLNSLSTGSFSGLNQEILDRTNADNLETVNRTAAITNALNAEVVNRDNAIAEAIALLESRLYSI